MTTPLRVTLVTGAYHPQISSSALQCRAMAKALGGRVNFSVLTTATDPSLPPLDTVDAVPVYRVIVDPAQPGGAHALWQLMRQYRRAAHRADVIHLHGVSKKTGIIAALAAASRVPLVITLHTSGQDEPDAIRQLGAGGWWGFRRAARIVSVSPRLSECYLQAGLPPARLVQIANGIDLKRFHPADASERHATKRDLGLPPDPMILFVGFFSRDKRPDFLFDAWIRIAMSRPSTLAFVGSTRGTYREIDTTLVSTLRERARGLGLEHRLRVIDPTLEIDRYYRAADTYVLSSRREAMPVALLEAMASGLPVIATRLAGVTDGIITDGRDGYLFDVDDTAGLAAALDAVLGNDAGSAAMGAAARRVIETRYSLESVAEQWLNVYRQVAA